MAGSIINPKRPRYQSNERFDTIDADQASRAPRLHDTALTRALLSTPRATAGQPTGLIVTGFSLTLNPVAGDGKVRINTELGVAIDADGNTLIKPSGTTVDISIPATGTPHQVYVYFTEDQTDTAKRRFIPATSPYTEYTAAIATALQGTIGTYVRSGPAGSIVDEDNVNGQTVPLVCIGIATNTAGTITCTGYNATTAPNGSDITNRLTAVTAPTTAPTVNTRNGSPQSLHDLTTIALHSIGNVAWAGSAALTPAAANNFGAYDLPTQGVQRVRERIDAYESSGLTSLGPITATNFKFTTALAMHIPALMARDTGGGGHTLAATGAYWTLGASSARLTYPVMVPVGMRITGWSIDGIKVSGGACTLRARLFQTQDAGVETALGTESNTSAAGTVLFSLSNTGLTVDVTSTFAYYLAIYWTGAGGTDQPYSARITYTRP